MAERHTSVSSTGSESSTRSTGGGVSSRLAPERGDGAAVAPPSAHYHGEYHGTPRDQSNLRPLGAVNLDATIVVCQKHQNVLFTRVPDEYVMTPSGKERFNWFPFGEQNTSSERARFLEATLNEVMSPKEVADGAGRVHYQYSPGLLVKKTEIQVLAGGINQFFRHSFEVRILSNTSQHGCCGQTSRMIWVPIDTVIKGLQASKSNSDLSLPGFTKDVPILIHPQKADFIKCLELAKQVHRIVNDKDKTTTESLGTHPLQLTSFAARDLSLVQGQEKWSQAWIQAIQRALQRDRNEAGGQKASCGCEPPNPHLCLHAMIVDARGETLRVDPVTENRHTMNALIAREQGVIKVSQLKKGTTVDGLLNKSAQRLSPKWPPNKFIIRLTNGKIRKLEDIAHILSAGNVKVLMDTITNNAKSRARIKEIPAPVILFPGPCSDVRSLICAGRALWPRFPSPTFRVVFGGSYFESPPAPETSGDDISSPLFAFLYLVCMKTIMPKFVWMLRGPKDVKGTLAAGSRLEKDCEKAFPGSGKETVKAIKRMLHSMLWCALCEDQVFITPCGIPTGQNIVITREVYLSGSKPTSDDDSLPEALEPALKEILYNETALRDGNAVQNFLKANGLRFIFSWASAASLAKRKHLRISNGAVHRVAHLPTQSLCTLMVENREARFMYVPFRKTERSGERSPSPQGSRLSGSRIEQGGSGGGSNIAHYIPHRPRSGGSSSGSRTGGGSSSGSRTGGGSTTGGGSRIGR